MIESEQPTLGPPDRSMVSYAQYLMEKYPAGDSVDPTTQVPARKINWRINGKSMENQ